MYALLYSCKFKNSLLQVEKLTPFDTIFPRRYTYSNLTSSARGSGGIAFDVEHTMFACQAPPELATLREFRVFALKLNFASKAREKAERHRCLSVPVALQSSTTRPFSIFLPFLPFPPHTVSPSASYIVHLTRYYHAAWIPRRSSPVALSHGDADATRTQSHAR